MKFIAVFPKNSEKNSRLQKSMGYFAGKCEKNASVFRKYMFLKKQLCMKITTFVTV